MAVGVLNEVTVPGQLPEDPVAFMEGILAKNAEREEKFEKAVGIVDAGLLQAAGDLCALQTIGLELAEIDKELELASAVLAFADLESERVLEPA